MIIRLSVVALVVALGGASACLAEDQQPEKKPSFWMAKKLEYSERIMVGLVNEEFDEIGKAARSMNSLSQMEKWVRSGLPEYRSQLQIFQNANQQLISAAGDKNLAGAALAYVQLTLSCVNCHKVVRDSRPPNPPDKK